MSKLKTNGLFVFWYSADLFFLCCLFFLRVSEYRFLDEGLSGNLPKIKKVPDLERKVRNRKGSDPFPVNLFLQAWERLSTKKQMPGNLFLVLDRPVSSELFVFCE